MPHKDPSKRRAAARESMRRRRERERAEAAPAKDSPEPASESLLSRLCDRVADAVSPAAEPGPGAAPDTRTAFQRQLDDAHEQHLRELDARALKSRARSGPSPLAPFW